MPNRILKESICSSDNLNNLTPEEEVFFYRLMVNCDDFGRMDARAAIILAKLYPLRIGKVKASDIEKWIKALVENDLIIVYEFEGKPYLQMVTWDRHQQKRAKASKYPAPDSNGSQLISNDIICNQMITYVPEKRIRETRNEKRETSAEKESDTGGHQPPASPAKVQYAEFVSMTEEEHVKLINQFGLEDTTRMIEILNAYKGSKGKKYKSDYLAILNWVVARLQEEKQRQKPVNKASPAAAKREVCETTGEKFELYVSPYTAQRLGEGRSVGIDSG